MSKIQTMEVKRNSSFSSTLVTVTHNVHSLKYIPSFWCVKPSLELSTWQEVNDFLIETVYTANQFKPVSAK